MTSLRLQIEGSRFRDQANREVTLRGINVAGDAKFPAKPDLPSHLPDGFFDGDNVSFVGRPFSVEEANTHFSRLRAWGYNTIRYLFTWEAIEHSGPGRYDEEWIEHTIKVLRLAKKYEFYIFLDPHQDVWSRFTGGSGAPMWTLYAMGLKPQGFAATEAAMVHNTYPEPDKYPKMIWSTNYYRLACQVILTLFFAGKDFAPKAVIDGKNIQDYLQDHFIGACRHFAERVHEAGDLENDVIIGWESLNEPNRGLVGYQDISVIPSEQKLQKGTSPTAWQAMLTGSGRSCEIDTWDFGGLGPYKSGTTLVDPKGETAWLPADHDDSKYGWKRSPEWKLGECIWVQHGVWDPVNDLLLKKDYFAKNPRTGEKMDYEYFTNTYFMDFYRKYKSAIRGVHSNAIMFCQPPVLEIPPSLKDTNDDDPNMVYAPHYYDGITLLTKKWNRYWNVDVFGVLRGRYLSPIFAIKVGETAIRNCLRDQLSAIGKEGNDYMGNHPCVFTEIGIPFDMDDKYAYKTGDYSSQSAAMDANHFALEGCGLNGYTLWVYMATNNHGWGDLWNGEDLSIYSLDDRPLPASPSSQSLLTKSPNQSVLAVDETRPASSPSQSSPRSTISPSNLKATLSTPSIASQRSTTPAELANTPGYRAAEAYVRPSPRASVGNVTAYGFDLRNCTFTLTLNSASAATEQAPTEIFLPAFHFPSDKAQVEVSGGKWTISVDGQEGEAIQVLRWWHGDGDNTMTVRGLKRPQGVVLGNEEDDGYLEQCQQISGFPTVGMMKGLRDGVDPARMNGSQPAQAANSAPNSVSQIVEALKIVHNAQSSKESRQQASGLLEEAKTNADAPYHGFTLAVDHGQPPIVRHYGLSLLEYAIRHRWSGYTEEQSTALREWVLALAREVIEEDPGYVRNKIAQLWVEVAKRSWALEWMDMDKMLVELWKGPLVRKDMVLSVLETLSEDIFSHEDTTAGLRGNDLNRACVEIFTPAIVLTRHFPTRETNFNVRYGDDGWLARIGDMLEWCLENDVQDNDKVRNSAVKALAVLRTAMPWAIPKAIITARCVDVILKSLAVQNTQIRMGCVEVLHALYGRSHFQDDEFLALVCPMYTSEMVSLLKKTYVWSTVDAADIDEARYLFCKKYSEMMSNVGTFVEEKPLLIPESSDLRSLFSLFISILDSPSLTVSIPILHLWVKILNSDILSNSDAVSSLVGPLLEVCSQRLIRYEALPEDSEHPTMLFLDEDIDTIPERHAFLGNYRRYCVQVVEIIVRRRPFDAIGHILGQVDDVLSHLYDGEPTFQAQTFSKNSIPVLRVDAHFTVVEAALKGYVKWVSTHGRSPQQNENERNAMEVNFETWCQRLLNLKFEDPMIKQRVIKLAVEFSTRGLDRNPSFSLKVLEHILSIRLSEEPDSPTYSEAVRELQSVCSHELQRLAMRYPDYFVTVYDELDSMINEITNSPLVEEKQKVNYYAVLFIIMHRSATVDQQIRGTRLESFLSPIKQSWDSPELRNTLSTFQGFTLLLGIERVQQYLISRKVNNLEDWSAVALDDEGKALQSEMNAKFLANIEHKLILSQQLPLRPTKTFLGVSTERLKKGSQSYQIASRIWQNIIPSILPNLLQFISHAHAFHNPNNWSLLPDEMQSIVSRILTDRFWQAGISTGSRDEFYARVTGTKLTLEGFASSIRGSIRAVRETCYSMLFCMSRLHEQFYGIKELPGPLAHALFADAHALSSHQFSILLNMASYIIDGCPVELRPVFLPAFSATLFSLVDSKVSAEWEIIEQRNQGALEDGNLTNEMKDESILRQLTFSAVTMVASLLDPQRENSTDADDPSREAYSGSPQDPTDSMRSFMLSSPTILEPLILFCTHALRMRDSRCCSVITRVLRSIVPEFSTETPTAAEVREFISNEVLKACITSLHEHYFVDLQKDLAQLISTIFILYSPKTSTPRRILLSLPGMTEEHVDRVASRLMRVQSGRQQRALVLDLLDGLRGVSISEQGKIARQDPRKVRSAMQERYMNVDDAQQNRQRDGSPELGGVADMFA